MKYLYPAIFTQDDTGYAVEIPDLPGCFTCGDNLVEAFEMARDAISMWLCDAEDKSESIPLPSNIEDIKRATGTIVSLIDADTNIYRKENDNKAVKKTLSIPSWINAKAEKANINFSHVLQNALLKELNLNTPIKKQP